MKGPSKQRKARSEIARSCNRSIGSVLQRKKGIDFNPDEHIPGWTVELEREFRAAGPHVYDKAKWHYEVLPKGMPRKQAFVHTGMFAGWLMDQNMMSGEFSAEAKRFKRREITGPEAYRIWDGGLDDEMLTARGNRFAKVYYEQLFIEDYEDVLAQDLPSAYHVEDTWSNYQILKGRIDRRYEAWKKSQKRTGARPKR